MKLNALLVDPSLLGEDATDSDDAPADEPAEPDSGAVPAAEASVPAPETSVLAPGEDRA